LVAVTKVKSNSSSFSIEEICDCKDLFSSKKQTSQNVFSISVDS